MVLLVKGIVVEDQQQSRLAIRLLGEVVVERDGKSVALPQSKKTRALLAYLVATARTHRRDRLCSLLWDVTDDPRGALRWSLSKLRPIVNQPEALRIVADRETIAFEAHDAYVDASAMLRRATDLGSLSETQLRALTDEFRGEFLEGLELPEFHEFQAWCLGERERARRLHINVLVALLERLASRAELAVPFVDRLVQIDPMNAEARAQLVVLLARLGRQDEAAQHFRTGKRLFQELGATEPTVLLDAWKSIKSGLAATSHSAAPTAAPSRAAPSRAAPPRAAPSRPPAPVPLCGRTAELQRLEEAALGCRTNERAEVLLLVGEPGVGKSRLLDELIAFADGNGCLTLYGRAYEAELGRPYGPWIDALRRLGNDSPVSQGLIAELTEGALLDGRDRLFSGAASALPKLRGSNAALVICLDDIQWCDEGSVALLHYLVRQLAQHPILFVLAARDGELHDNRAASRVVRALERDAHLRPIHLERLDEASVAALVEALAPTLDPASVFAESGGNPLFALEIARAERDDGRARSLQSLVIGRVAGLPQEAIEVLRWCAVLGAEFAMPRLESLVSMPLDGLVDSLELLEKQALLVPAGAGYKFAHDVVRSIMYTELSTPRRQLMHRRVVALLEPNAEADQSVAGELIHHAAMSGNVALATRACLWAARRCLRVFANQQAETLARRGLRYCQELDESEQVTLMLDLLSVELEARAPDDPAQKVGQLEDLAQRAMDFGAIEHARMGFYMISTIRWQRGEWNAARRSSDYAEQISRTSSDQDRAFALAESARCLVLLERDMGHADAQALEARALSDRTGKEPSALWDVLGLLRHYEGKFEEAEPLFERAQALSRASGKRRYEFEAREHQVLSAIAQRKFEHALQLTESLLQIALKLRAGSEVPAAYALAALCGYALGEAGAEQQLEEGIDKLRVVDAKYRTSIVLLRAAQIDLANGRTDDAASRAKEALGLAELLERPSEIGLAHWILAKTAPKGEAQFEKHRNALNDIASMASAEVQGLAAGLARQM